MKSVVKILFSGRLLSSVGALGTAEPQVAACFPKIHDKSLLVGRLDTRTGQVEATQGKVGATRRRGGSRPALEWNGGDAG